MQFLALSLLLMTGQVIHVTDGDSLTVLVDSRQVKIRLVGIDAPERGQAFGTVATNRLKHLTHGKRVTLLNFGKDRYGRVLAVAFSDGRDVGQILIDEGLAWRYRTDRRYSHERAKRERRGLWADRDPVNPAEFRKSARSKR